MSRVLSLAIERQRAQRDLEREKQRFASLVQGVREYAIFSCDAEGHVQTWNEGAQRITGYGDEEILGEHVSVFYTDEDRREGVPERNLHRAAAEGSLEEEGWRRRKDGSRFWAHVTITALYDEEGNLRGFSKVIRDMTDRMRRERRLEESRRRYRTLVENFPNGAVALVDEDLRYRMIGGTPPAGIDRPLEEIRGRPVAQALPAAFAERLVPRYEAAFEGEADTFELEAGDRVYRFRVVPVRDEEGEVFAAMGMPRTSPRPRSASANWPRRTSGSSSSPTRPATT
jgi:PAS domain S-box-containing protein